MESEVGVELYSVHQFRGRADTVETLKIPSKAIAMLMSGELNRWSDLTVDELAGTTKLFERLNIAFNSNVESIGLSAATWRAAKNDASRFADMRQCGEGHEWCVPFGAFHLVIIEDESE